MFCSAQPEGCLDLTLDLGKLSDEVKDLHLDEEINSVRCKYYSTIVHRLKCLPGYKKRLNHSTRNTVQADYQFYATVAAPAFEEWEHRLSEHSNTALDQLTAHRVEFRVTYSGTHLDTLTSYNELTNLVTHTFQFLLSGVEVKHRRLHYDDQQRLAHALLAAAKESDLGAEHLRGNGEGGTLSNAVDRQTLCRIAQLASAFGNADQATSRCIRDIQSAADIVAAWGQSAREAQGVDLKAARDQVVQQEHVLRITYHKPSQRDNNEENLKEARLRLLKICMRLYYAPIKFVFQHGRHKSAQVYIHYFEASTHKARRTQCYRQPADALLELARVVLHSENQENDIPLIVNTKNKKHMANIEMLFRLGDAEEDEDNDEPYDRTDLTNLEGSSASNVSEMSKSSDEQSSAEESSEEEESTEDSNQEDEEEDDADSE